MTEQWRAIPGWEAYAVSDLGRVQRVASGRGSAPGKILKPTVIKGYPYVSLFQKTRSRHSSINVLVAEAFLGPRPSPSHQAAHDDGVRANCSLSNIRWATPKGNTADKVRHGTMHFGSAIRSAKLTESDVREIKTRCVGMSNSVVAKEYGVSSTTIQEIRCGRTWRHVAPVIPYVPAKPRNALAEENRLLRERLNAIADLVARNADTEAVFALLRAPISPLTR